jgi:hypothetical protein
MLDQSFLQQNIGVSFHLLENSHDFKQLNEDKKL